MWQKQKQILDIIIMKLQQLYGYFLHSFSLLQILDQNFRSGWFAGRQKMEK